MGNSVLSVLQFGWRQFCESQTLVELYKGELDKEIFDEDNNTNNIIKPFTSNGEAWQRGSVMLSASQLALS